MCVAIPSKIISINGLLAEVDILGVRRQASLLLLPDQAGVGDYVLIHAGFAVTVLDEAAAGDTLRLICEAAGLPPPEKSPASP